MTIVQLLVRLFNRSRGLKNAVVTPAHGARRPARIAVTAGIRTYAIESFFPRDLHRAYAF